MMILSVLVFSTIFALVIADMLPKPDKTPEEKLGEAITKYLSTGVKVRLPDGAQVKKGG